MPTRHKKFPPCCAAGREHLTKYFVFSTVYLTGGTSIRGGVFVCIISVGTVGAIHESPAKGEEPTSKYRCHCEEGAARRGNPHPEWCEAPPGPGGAGKRTDGHSPGGLRNDGGNGRLVPLNQAELSFGAVSGHTPLTPHDKARYWMYECRERHTGRSLQLVIQDRVCRQTPRRCCGSRHSQIR